MHMDKQYSQFEHAGSLTRPGSLLIDAAQARRLADECHLEFVQKSGRLQLSLRPGRQKALATVTLLLGLILLASQPLIPELGVSASAVRFASVGFGILLLLLSLYLPFNSMDLEISRRKIRRVRRWFGLAIGVRELRSEDLYELSIDRGTVRPVGSTGRDYALIGLGAFGSIRLLEHIPDESLMEAVRRQIMLAAGLRPSGTH